MNIQDAIDVIEPGPLTMKDKYIEEKYPVYFVWGERVDGHVDIATTLDDTIATVSQEHAEKLIQDRNDLVRRLCDMAQAFDRSSPEEFKKFWYGSCLAQAESEGVTDEEILSLADDCGFEPQEITAWDGKSRTVDHGWECTDAQLLTFACAIQQRSARPAIEPVPVSERLPGAEDCIQRANDHWCWGQERSLLTGQAAARWRLMRVSSLEDEAVAWLPHWFLPIPR